MKGAPCPRLRVALVALTLLVYDVSSPAGIGMFACSSRAASGTRNRGPAIFPGHLPVRHHERPSSENRISSLLFCSYLPSNAQPGPGQSTKFRPRVRQMPPVCPSVVSLKPRRCPSNAPLCGQYGSRKTDRGGATPALPAPSATNRSPAHVRETWSARTET